MDSESYISIAASDVLNSLKGTKLGKSAGIEGLAAVHFIHSHVSITVHLALLFSSLLHGFLPDAFVRTSIIPIKNTTIVTPVLKVTTGR